MQLFLLVLFRNSLYLENLMIFVQIFDQILRACVNTWSKNLIEKMPKRAILTSKWNFERALLILLFFSTPLYSLEKGELLPVLHEGRFQPMGNLPSSPSTLKMLPSKNHPAEWNELSMLLDPRAKLLFNSEQINQLREDLKIWMLSHKPKDWENFADHYFEYYLPWTKQPFKLSEGSSISYPTLGQLKAERYYVQFPFLPALTLTCAAACLLLIFSRKLGLGLAVISFLILTTMLALRVYILQRPPVSNMEETLLYVPWVLMIFGFAFFRKHPLLLGASCGLSGILLSLTLWKFGAVDLLTVQPVLNSNFWLATHVMMIVASYGILLLASLLGHLNLIFYLFSPRSVIERPLLRLLYLGVILLIGGTLLGGVWAAQSWGRFWDWDPKESWAFVSSAMYLLILHAHRFGQIGNLGLSLGAALGGVAISFTWYGVNYLLGSGLHSYGFGKGGAVIYLAFLLFEILFLLFFSCTYNKKGNNLPFSR